MRSQIRHFLLVGWLHSLSISYNGTHNSINHDYLDSRPLLLLIFHLVLDTTEVNGAGESHKK
jgi:hypothetical protein